VEIVSKKISDLLFDPNNARKHDDKNLGAIKGSLAKFGQQKPIVVDAKGIILAGNGTAQAAKALGWDEIDCVVTTLDGFNAAAYGLADNRSSELADWDTDILSKTLKNLREIDFDIEAIGFDESFLKIEPPVFEGDPDEVPENVETRCKPGDLWTLGNHRLLCGDSTNMQHVERLMGGEKADMVFTDPPYNVNYGANSTNPKFKVRTIQNDHMSEENWDQFVKDYLSILLSFCDGAIYIAMSSKELGHLQNNFQKLGGHWSSFIVWVKDTLVIGMKDYHSKYEAILYGWREGSSGRIPNEDRKQTDVWEIPRPKRSDEHPTMKPVELVEKAINLTSKSKATVLDLFLGSGSTLIACEKTNRKCYGMEIDPHYCSVIIERWEKFTGKTALLSTD
jgi:DNA modification methylase